MYLKMYVSSGESGEEGEVGLEREVIGLHRDGHTITLRMGVSKLTVDTHTTLVVVVRDITQQKQAEEEVRQKTRQIKLLKEVATAANQAQSFQDAIKIGLHRACEFIGAAMAHCYLYEPKHNRLFSTELWYDKGLVNSQNFRSISEHITYAPGEGWIGKVFADPKPTYLEDIKESSNFTRREEALQCGLRTGFACPIYVGRNIFAIMEFYYTDHVKPEERVIETMAGIGQQLGYVLQRQRAEEALVKAKQDAESASRAKSEFLANMSHELRTPMNGVMGMAALLMESPLEEEEREYSRMIHGSAQDLLTILNDILDFSKIEAGALVLEHIPFNLNEQVEEIVGLLQTTALAKGLTVKVEYDPILPKGVVGDAGRIRQIITNLSGNAIKFTEQGSVSIRLYRVETEKGPFLRCEVEDTGIGIPAKFLPTIFDKFTQADESTTRKYGGTGLGLAITRQLVEMMGGNVGVESTVGIGSVFWFQIPLEEAELQSVTSIETLDMLGHSVTAGSARVLLVEDHPINQVFANKLLSKLGFAHIDVAANGQEALHRMSHNAYDIVLMDCQMPEMDGYEATRAIREIEKEASRRTPIIAMTANAMVGDREKCLKTGMDDYLSKPISPNALKTALEKWLTCDATNCQPLMPKAVSNAEENSVVDMQRLAIFTDHNPEVEKEIFDLFLSQGEHILASMQVALQEGEEEGWRKAAHKLKGAAANLGAVVLSEACLRAEKNAHTSPVEREAMLHGIIRAFDAVRKLADARQAL
ncbi:MAG: response regulator [Rickettsiales bacterium]|nr:response regulator [Rickettsiales bacterium]